MSLLVSDDYAHVVEKARWSHAHGRSIDHIQASDIEAGRLFSYGFRTQTIGTFHATRVALEAEAGKGTGAYVDACLSQCCALLDQLEAKAVDPILPDHRALISTLYSYDQGTNQVDDLLTRVCARGTYPRLRTIHDRFLRNIQRVTAGNGFYVARALELPEQGAFIVPDLDISIAPVIYGDHFSWNAAFLVADRPGVAVHRHRYGAEIHLGYAPVKGHTILGDSFTEVEEGYAMPIPPMTYHGFYNTSGEDHVVPFVFGSLKMAGWGIFFDVEPQPVEPVKRRAEPLESPAMNHSIFLERAIRKMRSSQGLMRQVLVPAHRAGSNEIGGLELAVSRAGQGAMEMSSPHYRIISVDSGRAQVQIGNVESEVTRHDHFGVPAEISCQITPLGPDPFVFLDARILPVEAPQSHSLENLATDDGVRQSVNR
jgi:uncharacterized RmlC-like cupin family protein